MILPDDRLSIEVPALQTQVAPTQHQEAAGAVPEVPQPVLEQAAKTGEARAVTGEILDIVYTDAIDCSTNSLIGKWDRYLSARSGGPAQS